MKKLESYLQDLNDFDSPKLELEQYATPPHIAALILNTVNSTYDDLQNKLVADLGCGTGRLLLGSILCGAAHVIGFDIDDEALKGALVNIQEAFEEEVECNDEDTHGPTLKSDIYSRCPQFNLVQIDVASETSDSHWSKMNKMFDTVIMNPPFGTKHNAGIDMRFLNRAIKLSNHTVYSLHKTSTRNVSCLLRFCP